MQLNEKIYVAGHQGMVGSAICRKLLSEGYSNLIVRSSSDLDLRDQSAVKNFFEKEQPEYVIMAAAKVGGILANQSYPAEFIYDNLMIQNNIIHQSYVNNVEKLLFLASSCVYPKMAPQPIKEEYLLEGPLEPTNESYAIAKISGIKMCEAYRSQYGCNFISAMPSNLYGPEDNYDLQNSHVLPAMIRKFHEAKKNNSDKVEIWGSGAVLREFLYVDDLADACLFLLNNYNEMEFINVGAGKEISIRELALKVKKIVGYKGDLFFNKEKPEGTPRKLLDVSRLKKLGWTYSVELDDGILLSYNDMLSKFYK